MCIFCAAIPLTAAAGASFHRKQQKNAIQIDPSEGRPRKRQPVGKATAAAITLLLICSVYYHTHYGA